MAIAIVGSVTKKDGADGGTGTSLAFAAINVSTGNLMVIGIIINNGSAITISSITDTASNTYTQAIRDRQSAESTSLDIWYAQNVTGNASNVITANFSGSAGYAFMYAAQYSGAATASALDQTSTGYTTGTSVASSAFTTTQADEVLTAIGYYSSADTPTAGSGYTMVSDAALRCLYEYQIVSSIQSSVTAGYSTTGSNSKMVVVATFKAVAAAAAAKRFLPITGAGA